MLHRARQASTRITPQPKTTDQKTKDWPHSGKPGPTVDPPLSETWAALEALHREGRCRAIGVSNFSAPKIQALLDGGATVTPAVLQIEAHPYW
jgi:diketogulonate reductase-like aldo/keto reductase